MTREELERFWQELIDLRTKVNRLYIATIAGAVALGGPNLFEVIKTFTGM